MNGVKLSKRTGRLIAACCNTTILASDQVCPHCKRPIATPAQERWPIALGRAYNKAKLNELRQNQEAVWE